MNILEPWSDCSWLPMRSNRKFCGCWFIAWFDQFVFGEKCSASYCLITFKSGSHSGTLEFWWCDQTDRRGFRWQLNCRSNQLIDNILCVKLWTHLLLVCIRSSSLIFGAIALNDSSNKPKRQITNMAEGSCPSYDDSMTKQTDIDNLLEHISRNTYSARGDVTVSRSIY